MWILATVIYILTLCSALCGQMPNSVGPVLPDLEDMTYKHLSPEAFFSMKDNQPPIAPMGPLTGPMRPGVPLRPGPGPRGPGARPVGPGIGSMGIGAQPLGPGMRPMGPGMGPMGPGMGIKGPGMGPVGPGMGPMKPGLMPGKPMGPGMGTMGLGMGPMGPGTGPMDPGMGTPGKREYEHFDLSLLDDMARQQIFKENYAEEVAKSKAGDEQLIYNLCFALSYIWRRGRESIRKYFHLRDIYHNHLPFEVGYITHVIMSKYQTMLELYHYSSTLAAMKKNTITRLHLTHFHETMTSDGLAIQHLSNMLHEIKNKYAARPYDPGNKFDVPPPSFSVNKSTTKAANADYNDGGRLGKEEPNMNKAYIAKKIEDTHKAIDESITKRKKKLQAARDFYKKHGYMPTTTRIQQQPMRLWSPNLDYGWSGEEEW